MEPVRAASIEEQESTCIPAIYQCSGQLGMNHTLYFVRQISPEVLKAAVWLVVCQYIVLAHNQPNRATLVGKLDGEMHVRIGVG